MTTYIPDTKRYKKEMFGMRNSIFRSTLFPADKRLMRGSIIEELISEILLEKLNLFFLILALNQVYLYMPCTLHLH